MYGDSALSIKTIDLTGYGQVDPELEFRRSGLWIFSSLHRAARWARLWSGFRRRAHRLQSLDEALDGRTVRGRRPAGVRDVPIASIRGSEGRNDDFDGEFRPLRSHHKDRWLSIFGARHRGITLPPLELIQVGERFFVRDGHHRISVAKALGQQEIEADVTVWELS